MDSAGTITFDSTWMTQQQLKVVEIKGNTFEVLPKSRLGFCVPTQSKAVTHITSARRSLVKEVCTKVVQQFDVKRPIYLVFVGAERLGMAALIHHHLDVEGTINWVFVDPSLPAKCSNEFRDIVGAKGHVHSFRAATGLLQLVEDELDVQVALIECLAPDSALCAALKAQGIKASLDTLVAGTEVPSHEANAVAITFGEEKVAGIAGSVVTEVDGNLELVSIGLKKSGHGSASLVGEFPEQLVASYRLVATQLERATNEGAWQTFLLEQLPQGVVPIWVADHRQTVDEIKVGLAGRETVAHSYRLTNEGVKTEPLFGDTFWLDYLTPCEVDGICYPTQNRVLGCALPERVSHLQLVAFVKQICRDVHARCKKSEPLYFVINQASDCGLPYLLAQYCNSCGLQDVHWFLVSKNFSKDVKEQFAMLSEDFGCEGRTFSSTPMGGVLRGFGQRAQIFVIDLAPTTAEQKELDHQMEFILGEKDPRFVRYHLLTGDGAVASSKHSL